INKLKDKKWKSFILASDEDGTIIAGGQSQGLKPGMQLAIMTKGKQVKNPQTGIMVELPGKQVGTVEIVTSGGETAETEYSIVNITSGEIDASTLEKYIIQEF
ncbi:MAG: penicillin-binding protein activator LpoB, partial [Bacteroidaceae bacterium]|nr:penicillin-binding protein activator LpoB [Bacteroidaceae bacterium]MCF0186448.1 penicillin-binding protein activator LpoB [Bacteroidaceae bacterium]